MAGVDLLISEAAAGENGSERIALLERSGILAQNGILSGGGVGLEKLTVAQIVTSPASCRSFAMSPTTGRRKPASV